MLQLLLQQQFVDKSKLLKEYEKISKSPATPDVLKYLGVSEFSDNKTCPAPKENKSKDSSVSKERSTKLTPPLDASSKENRLSEITGNNEIITASEADSTTSIEKKPVLVLSSRIKPIEEVVVIKKDVDKEKSVKEDEVNENYIYNDLLSPYTDQSKASVKPKSSPSRLKQNGCTIPPKSQNMHRDFSCKRKEKQNDHKSSLSQNKGSAKNKIQFERDITEYFLVNKSNGDIDFPKLLRDEISIVDKLLIEQAKKSMQIGGMYRKYYLDISKFYQRPTFSLHIY